jgi:malate synthase
VPLYNLMEDAATAEISRAQVWQWLRHGAARRPSAVDGRARDAAAARRRDGVAPPRPALAASSGPLRRGEVEFLFDVATYQRLARQEFLTLADLLRSARPLSPFPHPWSLQPG